MPSSSRSNTQISPRKVVTVEAPSVLIEQDKESAVLPEEVQSSSFDQAVDDSGQPCLDLLDISHTSRQACLIEIMIKLNLEFIC